MLCTIKESERPTSTYSDWDAVDPDTLLYVTGRRTMSTEFGYLFRHYWIPASTLRFGITTKQRFPDGIGHESSMTVEQEMARCNADVCTWRERSLSTDGWNDDAIRFHPFFTEERICTYDRSNQTFLARLPGVPHTDTADLIDPRFHAMLHQPILTPLLPVPLGFQWHVKGAGDGNVDYIDFALESVVERDGMTVLMIRKRGEFEFNRSFRYDTYRNQEFRVRRQGITAYDLERSLVLEDRIRDTIVTDDPTSPLNGLVLVTIRKLLSCR